MFVYIYIYIYLVRLNYAFWHIHLLSIQRRHLWMSGCHSGAVLGGVPARRYWLVEQNKIAEKPGEKIDKLGSKPVRPRQGGSRIVHAGMG